MIGLPFGPVTLIFYWPKKKNSGQPKAGPHFRHRNRSGNYSFLFGERSQSEKMTSRTCASIVNVNKDGERTCDTDVH